MIVSKRAQSWLDRVSTQVRTALSELDDDELYRRAGVVVTREARRRASAYEIAMAIFGYMWRVVVVSWAARYHLLTGLDGGRSPFLSAHLTHRGIWLWVRFEVTSRQTMVFLPEELQGPHHSPSNQ